MTFVRYTDSADGLKDIKDTKPRLVPQTDQWSVALPYVRFSRGIF